MAAVVAELVVAVLVVAAGVVAAVAVAAVAAAAAAAAALPFVIRVLSVQLNHTNVGSCPGRKLVAAFL